ncbi:hypothetical protein LOK49_LG02G01557 [Camellia lanceoleosa]|uniref:Uncharacterized protein n=1 Tax=Camellia lanceoleosa TaxID=1840588 RepID=A0ACC0IJ84_9ERIC|nr:hypothetical protein LOK49_LG02G01557 [Camellia lanceoleosa]
MELSRRHFEFIEREVSRLDLENPVAVLDYSIDITSFQRGKLVTNLIHVRDMEFSQSGTDYIILNGGTFDGKQTFFLVSDSPAACATVTMKVTFPVIKLSRNAATSYLRNPGGGHVIDIKSTVRKQNHALLELLNSMFKHY